MYLKARPQDDLSWEIVGEPKIFEFDLGLNEPYFPIDDQLQFAARAKALTHFTETVWPNYSNAKGILYRGPADFSSHFLWNERHESNFVQFKETLAPLEERHQKRLFCASIFVYYFQMLAHKLPDEMQLKLILDSNECGSLAEKHHLLSPERFEHFEIEHELLSDSNCGILFPSDELCSQEILSKLDAILEKFENPRAIYEPLMTEQWDGLDELYILPEALSEQGRRGVMGFLAAGGKVIEVSG